MQMLEIKNLNKKFGGVIAVDNLSYNIEQGEIFGLIGPNGAGKTTTFNMICGTYLPTSGEICYLGERISGLQPYQIARKGISRTFQNVRLFNNLTAAENIYIGGLHTFDSNTFEGILNLQIARNESNVLWRRVNEILEYLEIKSYVKQIASNLPYGHQRRLEIARAIVCKPKLLLLDEPSAGMNPQETEEIMKFIQRLRDDGITILVIEHDMRLIMGICDRIIVLNYGQKIAEGTPKQIQTNSQVINAYLGGGEYDYA